MLSRWAVKPPISIRYPLRSIQTQPILHHMKSGLLFRWAAKFLDSDSLKFPCSSVIADFFNYLWGQCPDFAGIC